MRLEIKDDDWKQRVPSWWCSSQQQGTSRTNGPQQRRSFDPTRYSFNNNSSTQPVSVCSERSVLQEAHSPFDRFFLRRTGTVQLYIISVGIKFLCLDTSTHQHLLAVRHKYRYINTPAFWSHSSWQIKPAPVGSSQPFYINKGISQYVGTSELCASQYDKRPWGRFWCYL